MIIRPTIFIVCGFVSSMQVNAMPHWDSTFGSPMASVEDYTPLPEDPAESLVFSSVEELEVPEGTEILTDMNAEFYGPESFYIDPEKFIFKGKAKDWQGNDFAVDYSLDPNFMDNYCGLAIVKTKKGTETIAHWVFGAYRTYQQSSLIHGFNYNMRIARLPSFVSRYALVNAEDYEEDGRFVYEHIDEDGNKIPTKVVFGKVRDFRVVGEDGELELPKNDVSEIPDPKLFPGADYYISFRLEPLLDRKTLRAEAFMIYFKEGKMLGIEYRLITYYNRSEFDTSTTMRGVFHDIDFPEEQLSKGEKYMRMSTCVVDEAQPG